MSQMLPKNNRKRRREIAYTIGVCIDLLPVAVSRHIREHVPVEVKSIARTEKEYGMPYKTLGYFTYRPDEPGYPGSVVIDNGVQTIEELRFTIYHEFAHAWLHNLGLLNEEQDADYLANRWIERYGEEGGILLAN